MQKVDSARQSQTQIQKRIQSAKDQIEKLKQTKEKLEEEAHEKNLLATGTQIENLELNVDNQMVGIEDHLLAFIENRLRRTTDIQPCKWNPIKTSLDTLQDRHRTIRVLSNTAIDISERIFNLNENIKLQEIELGQLQKYEEEDEEYIQENMDEKRQGKQQNELLSSLRKYTPAAIRSVAVIVILFFVLAVCIWLFVPYAETIDIPFLEQQQPITVAKIIGSLIGSQEGSQLSSNPRPL
ncbi:MAG: hypothetical protein EZS28_008716 [Streblomastix strix]|uniref:Uncharacterized protein n=1 Tax=Streblomastix strix TaxID=222440 RepID=A0A5J4WL27_9EUKA|nr:MAG: hypothetical protein EZS28_008716 [Streblomastix strix]